MKKFVSIVFIFTTLYLLNNKQKEKYNPVTKKNGAYYVNNHIIVNREYKVCPFYIPFPKSEAKNNLKIMIKDAQKQGFQLIIISGFRSYFKQMRLFNMYVHRDGLEKAKTYSAEPGYSEHQTGLAFDVASPGLDESIKEQFQFTKESKWLQDNAHFYGFIIRYPKGKEHITEFMYEPWHLRYIGREDAVGIANKNLTFEEYFDLA